MEENPTLTSLIFLQAMAKQASIEADRIAMEAMAARDTAKDEYRMAERNTQTRMRELEELHRKIQFND